ncbi:hypothetical protein V0288_07080 [Pannus brasiliensis CCIBt3594]|uniref:Uncharacterized protein n=1 Tax=Pannus brasiliensis CCIBt3594 TaxID=1427578 RepID=A0AAW9QTP0_9CHRO
MTISIDLWQTSKISRRDRSQESGVRSQESGVRRQETGVRRQETGDGIEFLTSPSPHLLP